MVREEKFKIVISEEGGDKLKDKLKDINIEALSAKDMMQKIADDIPNAASKIEGTLKGLGEGQKKITKEATSAFSKHITTVDELFKSFYGGNKEVTKRVTELSAASAKLSFTMEQIQGLNEKAYATLKETTAAKLTANQAEIDGLAKNGKTLSQIIEKYEQRKKVLAEQAEIAKASVSAEYEVMKKAGADAVLIEKMKAEQIAAIDAKLKEDLKQNAKSYETTAKAINDKLFNSFTADMEVTVDKTKKKTKEMTSGAAAEAAKALGIGKEALEDVASAAVQASDKSKAAATEAGKTTEAAAKTAEATKNIIDIDSTRDKIDVAIKGLEHYRAALIYHGKEVIAQYDSEIETVGDNVQERKRLEAEKAEAIKFYGSEIIKTNQAITAAEKKEQDLSLLQWTQYAQKAGEVANSIKDVTGKVGDYLSTAFTAVSNVYKAEIEGIDEELTHLKNKNAEAIQIATNSANYLTNLKAEQAKAQSDGDSELVNSLQDKIDKEKDLYDKAVADKRSYEIKQEELNREKAKKQKEQEKIEKLNRKVTLLKNIGEATANVAQGATKALSYGPILGPILAAIVTAAGVVQIGIMAKQLAKFADGGLLNGKRHSQGGMRIEGSNIEVEGGEYVVNRESTSKNLGLVRYINSERRELKPADLNAFFTRSSQGFEPSSHRMFENGGQLPIAEPTANIDNETLVQAIRSIRIEPRVAVSDIHKVQDSMVSVDSWTGV
jgi:hypothetical protein